MRKFAEIFKNDNEWNEKTIIGFSILCRNGIGDACRCDHWILRC